MARKQYHVVAAVLSRAQLFRIVGAGARKSSFGAGAASEVPSSVTLFRKGEYRYIDVYKGRHHLSVAMKIRSSYTVSSPLLSVK